MFEMKENFKKTEMKKREFERMKISGKKKKIKWKT